MKLSALLVLLAAPLAHALGLTGAVYDEERNGVAGVRVEARIPITHAPLQETKTAADGGFAFDGLEAGVVEIAVGDHAQYALVGDDVTVNLLTTKPAEESEPESPPVPAGEGVVRGVVRLDGKPLAHAPVLFFKLSDQNAVVDAQVVADEHGAFEAHGLKRERYVIAIDASLASILRNANGAADVIDLSETAEATVNVAWHRAPMVRGRVLDADGKPVPRAPVKMVLANDPTYDPADAGAQRTDGGGRYAFPLGSGWAAGTKSSIAVDLPLHSIVRSKPFPLVETDTTIDVTLPRFQAVTVRVSDRAGQPVPQANVGFGLASDDLPPLFLDQRGAPAGDDGKLVLQLAKDNYDFSVTARGFQPRHWSAAAAPTIDVVLDRAATLGGRVHRGDTGITGVRVTVVGQSVETMTDDDGRYSIDGLPAGSYRLIFSNETEWVDESLEVQAPVTDADVALRPTGQLEIRAVDAQSGEAIRGFFAGILPEGYGSGTMMRTEHDGALTQSVPFGAVQVMVIALEYTATKVDTQVVAGKTAKVEVRLTRGASLSGHVFDEKGDAIENATLEVSFEDPELYFAANNPPTMSDANGEYRLSGLPHGSGTLTVSADGYVPLRRAVQLQDELTLDVRLGAGLVVRGVVLRAGKPLSDVPVIASTSAPSANQMVRTDEEGHFVLSGLTPTRYKIEASFEGTSSSASIDPSSTRELVFRLDRERGSIYGTVLGYVPAPGRRRRHDVIVHVDGDSAQGEIDDAGNYHIEDSPLGEISILAYVEGDRGFARTSEMQKVTVRAGDPLRVDLRLDEAVHVRGTVTAGMKRIGDATVTAFSKDMAMVKTLTAEDGTFELSLPREAEYEISVASEGVKNTVEITRVLHDGDRVDVDIVEAYVSGTVVDALTNLPLQGVRVQVYPANSFDTMAEQVFTDVTGHFTLVVPAGTGEFRLFAVLDRYVAAQARLERDKQQYSFALMPASVLRVRTFDAQSGVPLSCVVKVEDRDGGALIDTSDILAEGTEHRIWLAEGRYRITVQSEGYAERVLDVTAPGVFDVALQ